MTTINAQINTSAKISAKSLVIGDVSKRSLGLDAVDNTSDLDKPISTAQQTAIDLKANQATTYTKVEVDTNIANLVDTAPAALDTLNELAAALGDDENFATNITNIISNTNENIGIVALDVSLNTDDITTNAENIVAANEAIEDNATEIAIVKSLNVGTLFFLNDGTTLGSFASGQLNPDAVPDNAVRADIGHAVTILGNSAFNSNFPGGSLNILTEVTIPTSVTEIQNSVFAYQKLTNIDIPNSVTSIGSQCFRANLLESLSISGSVISIGNSAFKDNLLTSVTFADTATAGLRIEASAFQNNLITELNIGTSANIIGPSAFKDNNLTHIDIPSTVTSIGNSAFAVNTNLNTVTAFCPISAFSGINIFANTVSALTIYVDVDDNSWDSLEALNPSSYQGIPAVTIRRIART